YGDVCEFAFRVGQLLAERGCVVINGGLGGVMEAVSRGVKSRNGVVIGIVPGKDRMMANPYCDYVIATNMGHARNMIIVHSSDALIAVGGGYGTVSEIAIALKEGKTVVAYKPPVKLDGLIEVETPEEAANRVVEGIK
ncbi:TIGR00725 family protein, partial [Geoglobus sp.]